MQTCRIPRAICDELDRKIHRFLWAGTTTECKTHLVAWATVNRRMLEGGLGIQPMRELNSASLAKLGWRMIREPESLWLGVLHHKYCKGRRGMDMFVACRNPSNACKGITESSSILQKGVQHSIGEGRGTLFWLHRWVSGHTLVEIATRPVPSADLHRTVVDYWERSSGWRWEELREFLPTDMLSRIASIQVYPTSGIEDEIFWGRTSSRMYSIQSAINMMLGDHRTRTKGLGERYGKCRYRKKCDSYFG